MLNLFIRTFVETASRPSLGSNFRQIAQTSRFISNARQSHLERRHADSPKPFATNKTQSTERSADIKRERPAWQIQKDAMKEKLGGAAWNPRKKLSPDTMEGIRHLHQTQPGRFTTPILAEHFKVSPEVVRRILKSRWRPSDNEQEERLKRWDKRGEKIWSNLVELGIKPPKRWRNMGVGKAQNGEKPRWKSRKRNTVAVHDSVSDEDIIPIVDGVTGLRQTPAHYKPLAERMGV